MIRKRILEFQEWKNNTPKILLIHMNKSPHTASVALKELEIPFDQFDQDEIDSLGEKVKNYCGIIIGGGRLEENEELPKLSKSILEAPIKKIGVCLGHEILGVYLGGNLINCNGGFNLGENSEVIIKILDDEIFAGLSTNSQQMVKMEHFYMLEKEPPGSKLIATSDLTPISGFHHVEKGIWGVQFHPEKDWIKYIVLKNFYKICSKK